MTDAAGAYFKVLGELREEFPDFEVIYKSQSKLMKVIDVLLKVITFGQMKTFMTDFVTTVGVKMYVPDGWDKREGFSKAVTLRHERVHMRQKSRYFRKVPWLSFLWFSFRYCFWILPAGLAMARKLYEQEAYVETLRAWVEYRGLAVLDNTELREHIVGHFLSSNYFWTWPFRSSIEAWYDNAVQTLRFEMSSN